MLYRLCDIALIVGTFIRGIGSYEATKNDREPPFGKRIDQFIIDESGSPEAFRYFRLAENEAKQVPDDSLSTAKYKDQAEAHKAFAAAFSASN